jgi:16S rRNA (adenine1518-N6/adenine1519-N6)-dimethyltransferase
VPRVISSAASEKKKPKLGQHFLTDESAAVQIVDALGDVSHRTVFEIGPGKGVLTGMLAKRARRLIAVELDRVLAAQLRMEFGQTRNVEIIEGDVLAVDLNTVFGPRPGTTRTEDEATERVIVVGNIPYYITSDILLRLFEHRNYVESMVMMVQREVADRLAAPPGGSEYGLLSATAQLYSRVDKLFDLPPGSFSPPPKVHSAVVRLTIEPRLEELKVPEREFINFLKLSFSQKRKTLTNNLKSSYESSQLKIALEQAGIQSTVRAEALSLEESAAVFRALHHS